MEDTEVEEGEASCYFKDDSNIDLDIALSCIDEKLQKALGHFQKDFEGVVSAENLGAKFGGYGSFLPTYQRSPSLRPQPKTSQRIQNFNSPKSPNVLPVEGGPHNSTAPSDAAPSLRIGTATCGLPSLHDARALPVYVSTKQDSCLASVQVNEKFPLKLERASNKPAKDSCLSSGQVTEKLPMRHELVPNKPANPTEHRTLKVRIEGGSDNKARKNAAIYSGLGLISPSSSMGNSPSLEESSGMPSECQVALEESPNSILGIMTSFPVPGGLLLSPFHESLFCLERKEKNSRGIDLVPAIKCGEEHPAVLANDLSSSMENKKVPKEKKTKIQEKTPNSILGIMTSFPVPGGLPLSPLHESLLCLERKEKNSRGIDLVPAIKCGEEHLVVLANDSSSSMENKKVPKEKKTKIQEKTPYSILGITTSFPVPGGLLLSPLHESLLCLERKEKNSRGIDLVPAIKCGEEHPAVLANDSSSSMENKKVPKEKKRKIQEKTPNRILGIMTSFPVPGGLPLSPLHESLLCLERKEKNSRGIDLVPAIKCGKKHPAVLANDSSSSMENKKVPKEKKTKIQETAFGNVKSSTIEHNGNIEKIGLGLPSKAAVKRIGKHDEKGSFKDVKSGWNGNVRISAKKLGDRVSASLQTGSLDMETNDERRIAPKKRKLKEWQENQNYGETPRNNGNHVPESKVFLKESSDCELRKGKKCRVSGTEGNDSSTSKGDARSNTKNKVAKTLLSGNKENPVQGREEVKNIEGDQLPRIYRIKVASNKPISDEMDPLKRDLGSEQLSRTATSRSSKVSDSCKSRTHFPDVRGSPVESVSSSPMHTSSIAFERKGMLGNDAVRSGDFPGMDGPRKSFDGEANVESDRSGTARRGKVSCGFHSEFLGFPVKVCDPPREMEALNPKHDLKDEVETGAQNLALLHEGSSDLDRLKPVKDERSGTRGFDGEDAKRSDPALLKSRGGNLQVFPPHARKQGNAFDVVPVEAEDLRCVADRLKDSEFGFECNEAYFQAALKFLYGASLLETCNGDISKHAEMSPMQIYSRRAKSCRDCAHEYEKRQEMAAAALAYKCMEVAYIRIVYCKNSSTNRDRQDLQTSLQMVPQGESPSSSVSDVDNLNNQAMVDKTAISKGLVPHAGNHVIIAHNQHNFLRLLDFGQI
ncbi:hypothetical protein RHMOL_Rhmol10G0077500 [Rhododendron molle]|uniref:Uncharacterized protein n=1 Tax=Rhododendron molle TaxID=49168 RepID=A0ACC0M0Z7_RHOML|nr:hypothetical protein RHMOL_Rhmol10G0077500 [Rhododendron molle]